MKHEKEEHKGGHKMGGKHGMHHGGAVMGKKEHGFGAKIGKHMGKSTKMEGPHEK